MADDFLPKGTEIPASPSNFTKFKSGDNKIRILGSAITGWELWIGGKPVRRKEVGEFMSEELANADMNKFTGMRRTPSYFWAFPVYNYETKEVEILEADQKRILRGIESFLEDEDYGKDPKKYDLVINKDDETDPVFYSVRAKPPKELDKGIKAYCEEIVGKINLKALYDGTDPFEEFDVPEDT
jgi:hypothetical protein